MKKVWLVVLLLVVSPIVSFGALIGDLNGNDVVDMDDVVFCYSYFILTLRQETISSASLVSTGAGIRTLPTTTFTVPPSSQFDINQDSSITMDDVALLYGYFVNNLRDSPNAFNASSIEAVASSVRTSTGLQVNIFPNMTLGSSTVPIAITGIKSN